MANKDERDDSDSGLASLVSDASSDPRMKALTGDDDEGGDDEGDELETCLNEAYDAKENGDRAGFVSAMRKAIQGYKE